MRLAEVGVNVLQAARDGLLEMFQFLRQTQISGGELSRHGCCGVSRRVRRCMRCFHPMHLICFPLHACKRHEDALAVGSSSANLPQLFPACSSPTPLPLIDLQLLRVLTLPWKAFVTRMAWQLLPLSRAGNAGELTLPIAANAPPLSLHQGRLSLSSISFPCSPSHILLVIT